MAAPHQHPQVPPSLSQRKLQSTSRVTLEDWDRLTTLSDLGKASVAAVQDGLRERPLPPHVSSYLPSRLSLADDNSQLANKPAAAQQLPSRPETPTAQLRKAASRYDIASASSSAAGHSPKLGSSLAALPPRADPLELTEPVETTQQFYDWYARVENAMEREQEEAYRATLAEVEAYVEACDEVLEQLEDARGMIHEMDANYRFVEENSRALQVACETLLEEQVRSFAYPLRRTISSSCTATPAASHDSHQLSARLLSRTRLCHENAQLARRGYRPASRVHHAHQPTR